MARRVSKKGEREITAWIIAALMARPSDWVFDGYRLEDKPTGVALWVANGRFFCQPSRPRDLEGFSFYNKCRLWRAARKLLKSGDSTAGDAYRKAFQAASPATEWESMQAGIRCAAEWAGRVSPKAKAAILENLEAEIKDAKGGGAGGPTGSPKGVAP